MYLPAFRRSTPLSREAVSTLGFGEELLRILEPGGSIWMAPDAALLRCLDVLLRVVQVPLGRGRAPPERAALHQAKYEYYIPY